MREPCRADPCAPGTTRTICATWGGEAAFRIGGESGVSLPEDGPARFRSYHWDEDYLNLCYVFGSRDHVCAYMYAELESPAEQDVFLHLGTNDAGKAWVNGRLVAEHAGDRGALPSQNIARVTLNRGRNAVLLKIDQAGGGWGAYVHMYNPADNAEYVRRNFITRFSLETSTDLPSHGDTVNVRIANWPEWPEPLPSVTWTVSGRRIAGQSGPVHVLRGRGARGRCAHHPCRVRAPDRRPGDRRVRGGLRRHRWRARSHHTLRAVPAVAWRRSPDGKGRA